MQHHSTGTEEKSCAACSVTVLKGVGPKTEAAMARLGIRTLSQLIRHYPFRFDFYPAVQEIAALEEGQAAVLATPVSQLSVIRKGRFVMTQGKLADESGSVSVRWFNMPYLKKDHTARQTARILRETRAERKESSHGAALCLFSGGI